jgi:hypothetical protein
MVKLASILGKEARGPVSLTVRWLHLVYNVTRLTALAHYACTHLAPGEESMFFAGVTWIGCEVIIFSVRDKEPCEV